MKSNNMVTGFTFSRSALKRIGGSISEVGDGFEISFEVPVVNTDGIRDAFLDSGFTDDEAWRAIDRACFDRNWRILGEAVK